MFLSYIFWESTVQNDDPFILQEEERTEGTTARSETYIMEIPERPSPLLQLDNIDPQAKKM